ncbi:MAG: phosphate ABC transporter permease PstA [Eubacterium sp.]|jgi:phosphate transport system permease protein
MKKRLDGQSVFLRIFTYLSSALTIVALAIIIIYILYKGIPNLTPSLFAWEYNSENVSMMPAIINTLLMTLLTLVVAVPVGIGAAIYLAEYAGRGNKLVKLVRVTAETLSGIPSIVYGLFGSLFFVKTLGFGLSLLSGSLTLAIMILPLILRTSEEALLAVPDSYREGSFGLGAGRLRTIFRIVLPAAMPGILSGVILGIGRIVGESAALIFTAGTVEKVAVTPLNSARTLSVHMYTLSCEGFHIDQTYATAVVLLIVVIIINLIAWLTAKKLGGENQNEQ